MGVGPDEQGLPGLGTTSNTATSMLVWSKGFQKSISQGYPGMVKAWIQTMEKTPQSLTECVQSHLCAHFYNQTWHTAERRQMWLRAEMRSD